MFSLKSAVLGAMVAVGAAGVAAAQSTSGPPRQEIRELRREVEMLRQERDFLKKAAAYFASGPK